MEYEIVHNPDDQRFQTDVDGHRCQLDYTFTDDVISMNRVYVPSPVEGRGIAGAITRYALDYARPRGWKVKPECPYVATWIERHPDYADLIADSND